MAATDDEVRRLRRQVAHYRAVVLGEDRTHDEQQSAGVGHLMVYAHFGGPEGRGVVRRCRVVGCPYYISPEQEARMRLEEAAEDPYYENHEYALRALASEH